MEFVQLLPLEVVAMNHLEIGQCQRIQQVPHRRVLEIGREGVHLAIRPAHRDGDGAVGQHVFQSRDRGQYLGEYTSQACGIMSSPVMRMAGIPCL